MPRIAIIGAGLIGRSWAIVFARAGLEVALYDGAAGAAEQAGKFISAELARMTAFGFVGDVPASVARVQIAASLAEALEGADLVQENATENVETKRAIFAELDRLAGARTILASSTSGIVASAFTETLKNRERCLVAHPVNPPHLLPLVELVGAPWTSQETIEKAKAFYGAAKQVPIVVRGEIEGFILNRLQAALLSEAFRLVGEGFVSPQDLDKTVKDGLGLRWSFMGPFETIELNAPGGIPDYCQRYGPTLARLSKTSAETYGGTNLAQVMAQWGAKRDADDVAARMQWRDARLAALRLHKQSQPMD
ncbi:MAG: 3-hydroxyacyl-CoA dehydrogenase [Xanthobacteraceae bacterium]